MRGGRVEGRTTSCVCNVQYQLVVHMTQFETHALWDYRDVVHGCVFGNLSRVKFETHALWDYRDVVHGCVFGNLSCVMCSRRF